MVLYSVISQYVLLCFGSSANCREEAVGGRVAGGVVLHLPNGGYVEVFSFK